MARTRMLKMISMALLFLGLAAGAADAAEIKVLSAGGVRPVVSELGAQFERATGHKLTIKFVAGPVVKREIDAGEAFDVAISLDDVVDDLIKRGKIAADTRASFARAGLGVGVRQGAPKPDISSVDGFKRTLLNVTSVAYTAEGAAGMHFISVLDRLSIAGDMKPKLKALPAGEGVGALARGEVQLIVTTVPVIVGSSGIELAGAFPPELQTHLRFIAGVGTGAREAAAAKALIKFLTSPEAAPVLKAKGMEPGTP